MHAKTNNVRYVSKKLMFFLFFSTGKHPFSYNRIITYTNSEQMVYDGKEKRIAHHRWA